MRSLSCLRGLPLPLWFAAVLLMAAPAAAQDAPAPEAIALSSQAVQLDPDDATRRRIGQLVWRGGIEITARDSRIGGLSALLISDDGTRLLAVTDEANWLTATLNYDAEGTLAGIDEARLARLRGLDGARLRKGQLRDAESLARLPNGAILVSFERTHRIWRYPPTDEPLTGQPTAWPRPEGIAEAPRNGGLEALVALDDGGLLALSEDLERGDGKAGYLWRDEAWLLLTYRPAEGFKPTGASRLPGSGDLLVLERAFQPLTGPRIRLVQLAASQIRPSADLEGTELARWGLPFTVDNFEGLAARRGPDGETLVYLLSDDNFSLLQRTLLVMFELEE